MADYLDRFSHLHCDKIDGRPRPHKAVMLLSVSLLIEAGDLAENKILYNHRLLEIFRSLFAVAKRDSDQPTAHNPFFHLRSEDFWHLHANPGCEEALKHARQVKGPGQLRELVAYASLDPALHLLLLEPARRHELQAVLVQNYLNHVSTPIWQAIKEESLIAARQQELLDDAPVNEDRVIDRVRSTAFRRMIRELYDIRCAACGVRFFFDEVDLIDAAHLIPFSESGDDRPQNGMALCKNHHWLMDNAILAPGPGRGGDYSRPIWHVRKGLDARFEEHRAVLEIKEKSVILPRDRQYAPSRASLEWRMARLDAGITSVGLDYAE